MPEGIQRSVYIRAEDVPVWQRAQDYARQRRLTMSALIITALERYLQDQQQR
jgi:hypothetical protein